MKKSEQTQLCESIVDCVKDYRIGEIPKIDVAHVERWLGQFDASDYPSILRGTERFLKRTYISRIAAKTFIGKLVVSQDLVGNDPKLFWTGIGFLRLQEFSQSQIDMLSLLNEVLGEQFGLTTKSEKSTKSTYVYLDDISFSGNQIKNDLGNWIKRARIKNATIHVITIASHNQGEYYANRELGKICDPLGVKVHFWTSLRVENSPGRIRDAEVLWPTALPVDPLVQEWEATFGGQQYFTPRPPGGSGSTTTFSSEAERDVLEQAFMKKGAFIYSLPQNPNKNMRPLGFSALRTPGFGATTVTYRNCPNNAPLVLWWGDPNGGAPLNKWSPLLPRRPRG